MSGAPDWATSEPLKARTPAATNPLSVRVIPGLLVRTRLRGGLRLQDDLLRAPVVDFRGVDSVRVAAVHLVDGRELAGRLAALAELADDRAVELHLVDLAGELCGGG